ncbi:MerR-like helix-turn-helix DNA binding domain protein [Arthrobacter phage Jamun]|nr:MerR-like helix-turn-helix DNA binding domain protein [Arthrobacter phage Jamun]
MDSVAAAVAVGVKPSTLRGWAHRGLLKRAGTDREGRALYELGAVYGTAERVRAGRAGSVQR